MQQNPNKWLTSIFCKLRLFALELLTYSFAGAKSSETWEDLRLPFVASCIELVLLWSRVFSGSSYCQTTKFRYDLVNLNVLRYPDLSELVTECLLRHALRSL